jgi:hypothetical protein
MLQWFIQKSVNNAPHKAGLPQSAITEDQQDITRNYQPLPSKSVRINPHLHQIIAKRSTVSG